MDSDRTDMVDFLMIFPRKMHLVGRAVASKYLKDTRIKSSHLMVLKGISDMDGASQRDLCESIPFDKSYISTVVRELIDMGFVVNEASGKVHSLRLTDSGKDMMAMGTMLFDIIDNEIFGVLTDEERNCMTDIMYKINSHIDEVLAQYDEAGNNS